MEQLIFKGMETEEGRQAAALHNSIMAAKLAVSNALLDFCRGLKAMRDGKGYKALGFDSFEEYSVHAVGIKYRMAANYISAYEALGEKMIAENADIGITKLALLAQISDPEERAEAARENLNGMTVAEVKALVAEKNDLQKQLTFLNDQNAGYEAEIDGLKNALTMAEEKAAAPATVEATVLPADVEKIKAEARAEGRALAEVAAGEKLKEVKKQAKDAEKVLRERLGEEHRKALEQAKAEGAKQAKEEARREAEEKAAAELASARAAEEAAKKKAEEALKRLEVQSNAETVKFGLYMEQLQQAVNGMSEQIGALREGGKAEQAEKLNGVMAKILRMKLEEAEGSEKE